MLGLRLSIALLLAAACLLFTAGFSGASQLTRTVVTCGNYRNVQQLKCDSGVISVQDALYGRTNTQTCSKRRPSKQLRNTSCSLQGTVDVVRRRCDGRSECELNIRAVHTSDPCRGIFKYLQTNYTCVPSIRSVTCENSLGNLQCNGGQVIKVYRADYGRRDATTCSFQRPACQIKNVKCSRSTSKVALSCDGKSSCVVSASNSVFGDPCVGTYKYLEVVYGCVLEQFHTVACEGSQANLKCGTGQVISVSNAVYGRSNRTTCSLGRPESQIRNVDCSSPTNRVAQMCDGKSRCSVRARNSVFGDPCVGTYKYLEVEYTCRYKEL